MGMTLLAQVWMVGLAGVCLAQGRGPTRVEVVPVVRLLVAPTIELVGTVRPRLRTVVAAEVSGLVAAMPVDEGDRVTKGQLLCKLRDAPRRFAHAEALARRAELTAVLAERTAELSKAQFEMERTARLWEQDRSTDKERHDTRADHGAAKGRLDQARHALAAQEAVIEALADALARTEIRAPCDGHIVARHTEIGAWVGEGGAIVELVDLSTVRVRMAAPESIVAFCGVGAEAQVSVEAVGKVYPGKVSRLIPQADQRARTFPVEVDIANPTGVLKAGMFARCAAPAGPKTLQLVVPKDAVVLRGSVSMVFVVRSSKDGFTATPLPVEVLSEVVDHVAVTAAGLTAGDQVVVRGNESMFGPSSVIPVPAVGLATSQPAEGVSAGDSTATTQSAGT